MTLFRMRILMAGLLLSAPISAQAQDIEHGPVPDWVTEIDPLPVPDDATGLLFIRKQQSAVHLVADGQETFQSQHFALLNPQALQAGNIAIEWNPAAGNPTVHRLLVHRGNERIDVLETTDFEILRREDQLEQAMLDGHLTAVLRVPDLRVGDELELAYSMPTHDVVLGDESFGILFLGDSAPQGRIALELSWEEGQEPAVSIPEGLKPFTTKTENGVSFLSDNIPNEIMPKGAPPRYAWHRILQYSDFNAWPNVSRRFADLFDQASRLSSASPIIDEARRISDQYEGQRERAQAALDLVQQQVRYIYVGLNGGNFESTDADTTWQRRYGDCKGKTALLLALLKELDIEARAVLVQNQLSDDGLNERLPSPAAFDHVLVQAQIDGETHWLDGTLPVVAEMDAKPFLPYRWALPLTAEGADLQEIPRKPFELPQEMVLYELDARAGFDAPARQVITSVKRGFEGIIEYSRLSTLTPDQIEEVFRNQAGGEWDEIESVTYRFDRSTGASILTITGTGPLDWDNEGGGAYDLTLPGGGFNPPQRLGRPKDQDQTAPYYTEPNYSCHVTTVRLPEGTSLENWGYNSTFDTMMYGRVYYRMMEERDDLTIRMVRGSRVEIAEITPAHAERDNKRLGRFDNSMARITYDPDKIMNPWGKQAPVPAVYEFDWIGTDSHCLPEDLHSVD